MIFIPWLKLKIILGFRCKLKSGGTTMQGYGSIISVNLNIFTEVNISTIRTHLIVRVIIWV